MAGSAGPGAAIEGLRRALARLGAEVVVRDDLRPGAPRAVARALEPPRPAVRTPGRVGASVTVRAHRAPAAALRSVAPVTDGVRLRGGPGAGVRTRVRRAAAVEPVPRLRRGSAQVPRSTSRTGAVVLRAPVRGVPARAPAPVARRAAGAGRRMVRRPVPWEALGRPRLAAAWSALGDGHGLPGEEMELIGVYGPVPCEGVAAVSVGRVGRRAQVTLGPAPAGAGGPAPADLALARHRPTGRLLSAVVPRRGASEGAPSPPEGGTTPSAG